MYKADRLWLTDLVVEHQPEPLGMDVPQPRFGWKLHSDRRNTVQAAYRLSITSDGETADTGKVESAQSVEVTVPGFTARPMTRYQVRVEVTDNYGRMAQIESHYETGRIGVPFASSWVEPVQEPTPSSMATNREGAEAEDVAARNADGSRTFEEFRPAQYVRVPFTIGKAVKRARVYATAHGLYRLTVNGQRPDDRELAPENTAYHKLLYYQTYDVTALLRSGENALGVVLADGWWAGRVGTTGDCCQYGDTTALLLDMDMEYMDGTRETVTGESGLSSTGPIVFSDLFVGEKYDANLEQAGWDCPGFDDSGWTPVIKKAYDKSHLMGQPMPPVRPVRIFHPERVFAAPNGDIIVDAGQTLAGVTELTVTAPAGLKITLEHFEVLGKDGNYFQSILNTNKEQTDTYITRAGTQTYRPAFTYHGFRYVRVKGWPGMPTTEDFQIVVLASDMPDVGTFETSDPRLNQLQSNIWWSQVSNTVSIPTDCPQREKAGWTGDVMAYAPTLCFNRAAGPFLTGWMANVRAEQMDSGAVPMIVPYLKAYATFLRDELGADTSCGWGDAVLMVPYAAYKAYGDKRILEENYEAMGKWLTYIDNRAKNSHPEGYDTWDETRKARSRWLWNTDYHFGDWLIPSMVLGNPDGMAMGNTALATMGVVAPAYYAFSARNMAEIARILGKEDDAAHYGEVYENVRKAFIEEYVHADGTMDADFQGIYVIALHMGLATEELRPKMAAHLAELIHKNNDCLDTGFLSVLFLMDVLCDNGMRDLAYKLLFQTACPSWLYEVEKGATTMWESWGAIAEDGTVSTYSYNHYAFGCVGDWMYRHIGGLQMVESGYKKFRVTPALDCGLAWAETAQETPYGKATVRWEIVGDVAFVHVEVPANTSAEICLPGIEPLIVGSGRYSWIIKFNQ